MTVEIVLNDFFGKEEVKINLSSFMIFCGENGSGKTHLVKMLTTIDDYFRSPPINRNVIASSSYNLKLSEEIFKLKTDKKIKIVLTENDDEYDKLIELMNDNLKRDLDKLIDKTFSKSEDVISSALVKINKRPELIIEVNVVDNKNTENEFWPNSEDDDENQEETLEFEFKFISAGEKDLINRLGFFGLTYDDLEDEISESETFRHIILSQIINNLIRFIYRINYSIPGGNTIYFPASREAYMRDFSYFYGRTDRNKSYVVRDYDIKSSKESDMVLHSNDPFIEKFVESMIATIDVPEKTNNELVRFFERNFLRARIESSTTGHQYILEGEKIISPDLGSSLQNEYSFLRILLARRKFLNIVIEEPEAHLSIKNSVQLAYFLIAIHQKGIGKVWLTTHSNFITDSINNLIRLAYLPEDVQKLYLKKIGLSDVLDKINIEKVDEISAYFLTGTESLSLPKDKYGIEYALFNKQINDFIDITSDIQFDLENLSTKDSE